MQASHKDHLAAPKVILTLLVALSMLFSLAVSPAHARPQRPDAQSTIDAALKHRPDISRAVVQSRLDAPRADGPRRFGTREVKGEQALRMFGPDGETLDIAIEDSKSVRQVRRGAVEVAMKHAASTLVAEPQVDGGARVIAVMNNEQAAKEYRFTAPTGHRFQVGRDGSAVLLDSVGSTVADVPAPWAIDAAGKDVEAHYSVDGGSLVLFVAHEEATAYPVVADPRFIASWWGWTIKLTSSEWNRVNQAMLAGSGASAVAAYVCGSITAGVCAFPFALGTAILTLGRGVIGLCANSRGVDIHGTYFAPPLGLLWCSGY